MIRRLLFVSLLSLSVCGCSAHASPLGPSAIAVASPTPKPTAWPTPPTGLDPTYVRALVHVEPDGTPKHWAGGPLRHCVRDGVDVSVVGPIIDEMSGLTGVPPAASGPCNVEWIADYGRAAPSYTEVSGTATAIMHVRIFLYHRDEATARHEMGHAIGLGSGNVGDGHSPDPRDLMNATPRVSQFSVNELAVIAWIYGRR